VSMDRMNVHRDRSRVESDRSERATVSRATVSPIAAHPRPGTPMPRSPRITMSLSAYLLAGRLDHRGCFACGTVGVPNPPMPDDAIAKESRCGRCNAAAALAVSQAVREGWLEVRDDSGRRLNDRVQS